MIAHAILRDYFGNDNIGARPGSIARAAANGKTNIGVIPGIGGH